MSNSQSWLLGAFSLTALSVVLTRDAESRLAMAVVGGATLAVIGGVWWLWNREQISQPSPISEYLAIGYGWAFYASLVFAWGDVGDRWVDWVVMIPPISVIPPIVKAVVRRSSSSDRTAGILRVLHRLVAAVFFMSAGFFVLTVLGMILAPIPLVAGGLHLVAARFYARGPST